MRILSSIVALWVLGFATGASAQVIRVEPELTQPAAKAAKERVRPRASQRAPIALEAPSDEEQTQIEPPRKGKPPRIGFPRPVAEMDGDQATGRKLEWETLADGSRVAAVSVTSPGAAALRFGLRVTEVPAGAVFRFYDGEEIEDAFEVTGAEVLAAIAANRAAGEQGPDARTYWSPVIESETAVMEIELPAGSHPRDLRMAVPLVSHLVAGARTDFMQSKAAASCNVDAMCELSAWGGQMNAIARMVFSSGGFSYLCTGTLLADTEPATTVPYFLSANHCISAQATASSLVTYWFYRSTACDSGVRGPSVQMGGGATLLYRSTATDVSFMRLNSTPPAGTTYAGWSAGAPAPLSAMVTGLHHPTGDLLKFSQGSVRGYSRCTAPTADGQFSCSPQVSSINATFYEIGWTQGVVEGGSSGSALFDSGKYVIGQLYGGGSSCANRTAPDSYGRFDVAYTAGLSAWLNPPPPPPQNLTVFRSGTGSGSVASAPAGINCGAVCSASFPQGSAVTLTATPAAGTNFVSWGGACSGAGACTVTMSAAAGVTATFNTPPPDLGVAISPAALGFSTTQPTQSVIFTNNTGARVTFKQATMSSARFDQVNTCTEVAHGASCTAVVAYYPANSGPDEGTLTMTSTASNSPHVVSLTAVKPVSSGVPRLTNISGRMRVLTGNDVMIGGFVIGGSASKAVLVRARGPSLAAFGITTPLANPVLQLVRASDQATIASNDNWGSALNASAISATGFAPSNALEAAVYVTLPPGAYTAIASGAAGGIGVGLLEVFELDNPEMPLANLSIRGRVAAGEDVMIAGFVIAGEGTQTVVVRAKGPSLVPFGITNALANPTLQLVRSSDQSTVAANDDWQAASNAEAITASGFAPPDAREAAILVTLPPGAYTAIVSGVGGTSGVAIVEVFAQ